MATRFCVKFADASIYVNERNLLPTTREEKIPLSRTSIKRMLKPVLALKNLHNRGIGASTPADEKIFHPSSTEERNA